MKTTLKKAAPKRAPKIPPIIVTFVQPTPEEKRRQIRAYAQGVLAVYRKRQEGQRHA